MKAPVEKLKNTELFIFAGIYDSIQGSVPITHSINFHNKLPSDLSVKDKSKYVSDHEKLELLEYRRSLGNLGSIADRKICLQKAYGNIRLTIFEGPHEMLTEYALNEMQNDKQYTKLEDIMKRKVKWLFVALLFMPFALYAQDTASSGKHLNIFTLGDSNGTFPHSWPKQLQADLPNATVFNISKSGRTIGFVNNGDSTLHSLLIIDENLKKAAAFTQDRPFDYIVIELGTNDAKAIFANRQEEVPANLNKLIQKIKNSSYPTINQAKIIIISPPPYGTKAEATEKYKGGGKRVKNMSKSFKKVAKQNNCLFVNGYQTPGLDINAMTADGLHLDAIGSKKLIVPVVALMIK